MTITAVNTRPISVVLGLLLITAGCSGNSNQAAPTTTQQTTQTTTQETTPPATTETTPNAAGLRPECQAVFANAQTLVSKVAGLAAHTATIDDVRTAATTLSTSFDQAKTALGAEAQAGFAQASQALKTFQTALSAQPPNIAALRQSANDIVAGLGQAITVCSASPTASPPTT